ncbi:MAG: guanylate kinase [Terriglobales bacterium]
MNSDASGIGTASETTDNPGQLTRTGQGGSVTEKPPLKKKGHLIVVTGPSGVGKGTVVTRLLKLVPEITKSVSVTTRELRPGEVDGVDYFFRTVQDFDEMIEQNLFVESAEFAGHLYVTPKEWVLKQLDAGLDVILEIEVHGAKQIKQRFPEAILIFLSPPSFEELKNRLRNRATEGVEARLLRLHKARQEMRERYLFHYEVVNDNIDEAVNNLAHIVYAERCRIREMGPSNEHDKNS